MPISDSMATSKNPEHQPTHLDNISSTTGLASDASAAALPGEAGCTERSQTRSTEGLRDSEVRYRRLFEAAHDGILLLDVHTGMITDVNPFLTELLGYSHGELLGKTLWDIGIFTDIDASKAAFEELMSKRSVRYENLPLQTKDGQSISVEVVSNVYREDGHRVIQCNIRDIRQRKSEELSSQRLIQAQKMEAIGQLAGGLAHDFNNLLGVILGYCELLEEEVNLPVPAREMILEIHNAGTSAKNLTQRLLEFSHRQVLRPVVMDLNKIVLSTEKMLRRLIGEDIEVVSLLGNDLGRISADPNQIEQVLMNLAINARDAMPKGGKIFINTTNVDIDETYATQHPFIEPGRYVLLTISDTGNGMNLETQSHIFEPFFSTKTPAHGTGLGLSTVFGIVKQSGGAITVYSELGKGATFKVHFPRCDEALAAARLAEAKQLHRGNETILLVDDAASLRVLTRRLLEDCGYRVLDSGDPGEALRTAREFQGPLPLLITDVVMPGFSGPVLAERIAADRPETRVLYTSGYNDGTTFQSRICGQDCAVCSRHCDFLEKPFTREDLLRKVRGLLDSTT